MSDDADRRPSKARFSMFTYHDAPMFAETDMLTELGGPDHAVAMYEKSLAAGGDDGAQSRVLFRQAEPDGVSVLQVYMQRGMSVPRHSHDADCLYYVVTGQLRLGNRSLGPGDGAFVPGGMTYTVAAGPDDVEFLEIRTSTSFDMQLREGSPEGWDALVGEMEAHRDHWRAHPVPTSRRGLQGEAAGGGGEVATTGSSTATE